MSCCHQNCCVYFVLSLNILGSFLILLILFFGLYDISILKVYQIFYFILALLTWILQFGVYTAKLVLILIGKLPNKYLHLSWFIINVPAAFCLVVGFICDIIKLIDGSLGLIIYAFIYWLFCAGFIVCSWLDYKHLDLQADLSNKKNNIEIDDKELSMKLD